ncbi:unnamed protein product [Rhizophagus irregularis]|nr:unnamed protein product [Rhizophagus irregularis]
MSVYGSRDFKRGKCRDLQLLITDKNFLNETLLIFLIIVNGSGDFKRGKCRDLQLLLQHYFYIEILDNRQKLSE